MKNEHLNMIQSTIQKMGNNPFSFVKADDGKYLSEYVECYNPPYALSKNVYNDISDKIEGLIERAYNNSGTY